MYINACYALITNFIEFVLSELNASLLASNECINAIQKVATFSSGRETGRKSPEELLQMGYHL